MIAGEIPVLSLTGQEYLKIAVRGNRIVLDIEDLSLSIYLVQLRSQSSVYTQKLVKEISSANGDLRA